MGITDTSAPNTSRTRAAAAWLTALRAAGVSLPAGAVDDRAQGTDDAVEHAVPRDRGRQADVEGDPGAVERERREHPGVHVDDVGPQVGERRPHQPRPDGVHRQVERDPRAEPVDVHPVLQVDDSAALAADAQRGGQHVHLVPGGGLPRGEVTHLGLDPTGTRRVAVGDVDDQHGATVSA